MKTQSNRPACFFWLGLLLIILILWWLPEGVKFGEPKRYINDTIALDSPKYYYQSINPNAKD